MNKEPGKTCVSCSTERRKTVVDKKSAEEIEKLIGDLVKGPTYTVAKTGINGVDFLRSNIRIIDGITGVLVNQVENLISTLVVNPSCSEQIKLIDEIKETISILKR